MVVSIIVFYIAERAIGERLWRNYQEEAAARGVKLYYGDFDTTPIPDEDNYAAIPVFQKAFASPEGAEGLSKIFALPRSPSSKTDTTDPEGLLLSRRRSFLTAGWIDFPSDNPADDILAAMVRLEGPLAEVREASSRPKTQWPINWNEGFGSKKPIHGLLQDIGIAFLTRSRALLALDRPEEALAEIRCIVRASESLDNLPCTICAKIRNGLLKYAMLAAEEGLQADKWKAPQLIALSELFHRTNLLARWKATLDYDRCFTNAVFDMYVASDLMRLRKELFGMYGNETIATVLSLYPRGWLRRNQVEFNQTQDAEISDIDGDNERVASHFSRTRSAMINQSRLASFRLSWRMTGLGLGSALFDSYRTFETHSRTRQMEILCAIARYRQAEGDLPESLDQLVPKYIDAIPHDIMDGEPMRYRRTSAGGCVLWSIGENRVDDGGTRGKKFPTDRDLDCITELHPLVH